MDNLYWYRQQNLQNSRYAALSRMFKIRNAFSLLNNLVISRATSKFVDVAGINACIEDDPVALDAFTFLLTEIGDKALVDEMNKLIAFKFQTT